MDISPSWKRIAGIHVQDEGLIGAVWCAHDKDGDFILIYDACIFRREVLAVIAEGLNCRGRWIPVAWDDKHEDMADKLLERGCNMLPEGIKTTSAVAEVLSRDVWERMRTGRLKVDDRLAEWKAEFKSFYEEDSQVPMTSFPLMSATRNAVSEIQYARRQTPRRDLSRNFPKIAMV